MVIFLATIASSILSLLAVCSASAANYFAKSSGAAWWNCLISTLVVSYFGPLKAENTFSCTPMHKMPVVLMPALLAMAALSY